MCSGKAYWESPARLHPVMCVTERVDPATALWLGIKETWFVIDRTLAYIGGVFTGREAADQIGGPFRIAQISGQVATIGLVALIHLAAVLSISIGLLNLFPVPAAWMAATFCSMRSRPCAGDRCRNGRRKWASASVWVWF